MAQPRLQAVPLALIRVDADTQSRADLDLNLVSEYAEAWLRNADFPPLDVFRSDESDCFLADGFHRYLAAKQVSKTTVMCRIFRGSARDAFLFACTTNQLHGLRRTNVDKRYMVSRFLNDSEWVKWTDSRIAEQCGVSHTFVAVMRRELELVSDSVASLAKSQPRRGLDGKNYPPERKATRSVEVLESREEVERGDQTQDTKSRVLSSLRQIKRHLGTLGLEAQHLAALDAIERDVLAL